MAISLTCACGKKFHAKNEHAGRRTKCTVRTACVANLEFRQGAGTTNAEARDTVLNAKLDEMLSEASCQWMPIRNIASAELMSKPAAVYCARLETALADAVNEFTKQFFEMLAKLVDRELFGLVEWLPNHCCHYHFFKRVVIQDYLGESERVVGETRFDRVAERDRTTGRQIIGRQSVAHTQTGKHHFRFARHEHEVINAIRTSVGNSTVVMPPQIVRLVEAIPDWLYPFVNVIDGDIIRERIIEQDTGVEDWSQVEIDDEPIIGCEPGVIIGPFVLSGWGPREVEQEQQRRQSVDETALRETNQKAARHRAPLFAVSAAVLSCIALWLLFQTLQGNSGALFVILATAAAFGSAWQAAFDFATARQNPTAVLFAHFATATAGFQLLLAEWLVARSFHSLSWMTPVVLGLAAITSHAIGRRFN